MIADIGIVLRKELRELLLMRGSVRSTLLSTVFPMAFVGVFFGARVGLEILKNPILLATWAWLGMISVAMVVAEAFAGERERHTLETLLASRLPDSAILLGKLIAVTLYGVAIPGIALVVMFVTIFITHPGTAPTAPLIELGLKAIGVCLITSLFGASVGIPISLRAATVRQAAQTMSFVMMLLPMFLLLGIPMLPSAWRQALGAWFAGMPVLTLLLTALGTLVLVSFLIIGISLTRFQRHRLILD